MGSPIGKNVLEFGDEVSGFREVWVAKVLRFRQGPRIVHCDTSSAPTLTTAESQYSRSWYHRPRNHSIVEQLQAI